MEAMFETYDDDFQTGWAATTERLNAIADEIRSQGLAQGQDPQRALLEPVLSALGDWLDEKRQLDEGMLDENLKICSTRSLQICNSFLGIS